MFSSRNEYTPLLASASQSALVHDSATEGRLPGAPLLVGQIARFRVLLRDAFGQPVVPNVTTKNTPEVFIYLFDFYFLYFFLFVFILILFCYLSFLFLLFFSSVFFLIDYFHSISKAYCCVCKFNRKRRH